MGFKINKVKADLCSYPPYILLAPKKFGKTTFWYKLVPALWGSQENGLLISFGKEEGYHSLDGLQVERVKKWDEEYDEETDLRGFVQVVDDIVENNDKYQIKGVCIDTLDTFIDVATAEVLRQHKKEKGNACKTLNEAFGGYNRGKTRLFLICNEQIERLRDAGLAVWINCHIKNKEKTDLVSGEKYEQITNNLNDDIYSNFADGAQMVMVGTYDREIKDGKILNEERKLYLRGTSTVDAGGRFTEVAKKIDFTVEDFIQAFNDAVKAAIPNADDKEIAKRKKEEEKERKKTAEIAKRPKIDEDEVRCEYLSIITSKFADAKDEVKEKAKALLKESGCAKFTDENLSTEVLKEISELF